MERNVVFGIVEAILIGLSILFTVLSFSIGIWWKLTHAEYELSFSLWNISSTFNGSSTITLPLVNEKLESVILTARACMGICSFLFIALLFTYMATFYLKRKNSPPHLWLKIRTLCYLILLLFFLIVVSHSGHCPPRYKVGTTVMKSNLSWGWSLSLTAFIFIFIPAVFHFFDEFLVWRANRGKV